MLNLTWCQGNTLGAYITTLIPSSQNSFPNVLTLSPLSAIQNNITCSAKIFPTKETSQFLTESPIKSVSEMLMVESESKFSFKFLRFKIVHFTDHTIDVTIIPSSTDIQSVGNTFNMTCAVLGLDHVKPVFVYQWTNVNDDSISISSSESSSIISFPSLTLSNAGQYICKVNVSSNYFISGHEIGMKVYNLLIRCKKITLLLVIPTYIMLLFLLQYQNHHQ